MKMVRCPACQTVFRVRPEQLRTHAGMVRCGHCYTPFNAPANLVDESPSPETAAAARAATPAAAATAKARAGSPARAPDNPFLLEDSRTERLFVFENSASDTPPTAFADDPRPPPAVAPADVIERPETLTPTPTTRERATDHLEFEIPSTFLPTRTAPATSDDRGATDRPAGRTPPPPADDEIASDYFSTGRRPAHDAAPSAAAERAPNAMRTNETHRAEVAERATEARRATETAAPVAIRYRGAEERHSAPPPPPADRLAPPSTFAGPAARSAPAQPAQPAPSAQPALRQRPNRTASTSETPPGTAGVGHNTTSLSDAVFRHRAMPRSATGSGEAATHAATGTRSDPPPRHAANAHPDAPPTPDVHTPPGPPPWPGEDSRLDHEAAWPAPSDEFEPHALPAGRWWGLAVGILAGALVVQAAYVFRLDISRNWPQLRPLYTELCAHLRCAMPLPRVAAAIRIDSSGLEADPADPARFVLNAHVRNQAPHPQEYPHLELTITDARDRPVVRRVLTPAEWVGSEQLEDGFPAGEDIEIALPFLATGVTTAVGYRVYAFFP